MPCRKLSWGADVQNPVSLEIAEPWMLRMQRSQLLASEIHGFPGEAVLTCSDEEEGRRRWAHTNSSHKMAKHRSPPIGFPCLPLTLNQPPLGSLCHFPCYTQRTPKKLSSLNSRGFVPVPPCTAPWPSDCAGITPRRRVPAPKHKYGYNRHTEETLVWVRMCFVQQTQKLQYEKQGEKPTP